MTAMRARTIDVEQLSEAHRARMLELLDDHFENVARQRFLDDLAAKRWVILLEHGSLVCGFSTQTALELEHAGRAYLVF